MRARTNGQGEEEGGKGPTEGCFKVTHLLNDRNRRSVTEILTRAPEGFPFLSAFVFFFFCVNGHNVRPSFLFN